MRKIKFRGKRPDSGKWITGSLVKKGIFTYILGNGHFEVECSTEVLPKTVGEYTDHKSKSGVEIYEGDIVQSRKLPLNGEVCFRYTAFRVHGFILCELTDDVEVIGNIWENPELVKGVK